MEFKVGEKVTSKKNIYAYYDAKILELEIVDIQPNKYHDTEMIYYCRILNSRQFKDKTYPFVKSWLQKKKRKDNEKF